MLINEQSGTNNMAFPAEPAWSVTFAIVGVRDGSRSMIKEFNPAGADLPAKRVQLDTDIAEYMDKFNDTNSFTGEFVSTAFITDYVIHEKFVESASVPSFSGVENVYEEASIQAVLDLKNEKFSTWIPAPDAQIFAGNSLNTKVIDIADSAYLAYGGLFVTGDILEISDGDTYKSPLNVIDGVLRSVRSGKSY